VTDYLWTLVVSVVGSVAMSLLVAFCILEDRNPFGLLWDISIGRLLETWRLRQWRKWYKVNGYFAVTTPGANTAIGRDAVAVRRDPESSAR